DARRMGRVQSLAGADEPRDAALAGSDRLEGDARGDSRGSGRDGRIGRSARLRGRSADRGADRATSDRQEEVVMPMQAQLDRRAAVAALLKNRRDTLVVSGLGSPTYDLHSVGDHGGNFYLWGAMGGAALIGLGLAQAQPRKRVLALTGD